MYLKNIKAYCEVLVMAQTFNIDNEWANFISTSPADENDMSDAEEIEPSFLLEQGDAPKCSDIYISTKTKIAYLNKGIDLKEVFWKIHVIPYARPEVGVVKKQMKFNSTTQEELDDIAEHLTNENHFDEYIMMSINNPTGRIKFKDIRKINIGISKKDLTSYRCKKKSAFYNCFVMILRLKMATGFKEFHVKVFNTGKLEIPGIQTEETFQVILKTVINIMQPFVQDELFYRDDSTETVLINSNFNCGFYINRESLFDILQQKYNIQAIYDPCSYPGIQSKFYYNPNIPIQSGSQISEETKHLYDNVSEVSFMIFRTGSVLIVGKCDEDVLIKIYEFLKALLITEYNNIGQKRAIEDIVNKKDKKTKLRRKQIIVTIANPNSNSNNNTNSVSVLV